MILRLKFTKFDFRWGSTPGPDKGAYTADPLAVFKRPTSKRRKGKGRGKGREGRERKGKGMGGEGRVPQLGSVDPAVISVHMRYA